MSETLPPLLPCPFCGKAHTLKLMSAQELAEEGEDDPEPWMHSDTWGVLCDATNPGGPGGCGASGGFQTSEVMAVETWNRRAALAQREPLTTDETMTLLNEAAGNHWCDEAHIQRFARAIERAHCITKDKP